MLYSDSNNRTMTSLLPVALHPRAAQLCIKHGKHLVTASYISPSMRALHDPAVRAGVVLLNEIGLDPGIDHCSTHALLAQLRRDGKRVLSFSSFCGGFPAPENARGVPLGYKFSWTPRGVLGAALNGARFKLAGKMKEVEAHMLLREGLFPNVPVLSEQGIRLEGLPNRDSMPYVDKYGLGRLEVLRTVLRGTLRYPGFSNLMWGFRELGLLEAEKKVRVRDWAELVPAALASKVGDEAVLRMGAAGAVRKALGEEELITSVLQAGQWLGIVGGGGGEGPKRPMPRVPRGELAPIDLFAALLGDRLRYEPRERDMVVLSHEFVVTKENQPAEEEVYKSSLIAYGDPKEGGYTAMARTVGIPVAIAAMRVLDGKVGPAQGIVGVVGPSEPSVYEAVLDGLEKVGLGMIERRVRGIKTVEQTLAGY